VLLAGYAEGRLFILDGLNMSSISNKEYEHYNMVLENRTLEKRVINANPSDQVGWSQAIEFVIITNAEDLKEMTGACYIKNSRMGFVPMTPIYDATQKTLTLHADHYTITPAEMQSIHFYGPNDNNNNLCDVSSAGWFLGGESLNYE
jgi:hypothetical protein